MTMPGTVLTTNAAGVQSADGKTAALGRRVVNGAHAVKALMTPAVPVKLRSIDGSESVWIAGRPPVRSAKNENAQFEAVEIPEELQLARTLTLPALSEADTADAIAMEVRANSPFSAEDLVWGVTARSVRGGQRQLDLVMASRRQVSEFLASRWPDLASMARQPEVWAVAGLPEPVVLSGFGESVRLGQLARQTRLNLGLLMLATILSALALMTPTAQLRARALQAVDAFTAATAQATPLVRRRDELYALNDKLKALETIKGELVQPAAVLEYLTKILPDDTYLYSVDVQKAKITASGHTVDASALLQRLSADPRLRGVRSPTAVTRQPGATKEAFTVEFTMASGAAVSQAGQGAAIARIPEAPAAPAGRRADAASRFVIGGSGR